MDELTERLSEFESDELPDESTVRKKLKEYMTLVLLHTAKRGRETVYLLGEDHLELNSWEAAARSRGLRDSGKAHVLHEISTECEENKNAICNYQD